MGVTLLVVSAIGHPTSETAAADGSGIEETGAAVKHGIRGWLKNVHSKIVKTDENCTHGVGVIRWVKNKLGLTKTTTTEKPTTTETDYSGYLPVTPVVVVPQGEPEEGYGGDDITILDDTAVIPEDDVRYEPTDVDATSSVTENAVDPVDPLIDVRMRT